MTQRVDMRLRNQLDVAKWEAIGILQRLRHDERAIALERGNLPVDVQHLPLQKRGAVTGYDALGHTGWSDSSRPCGGRLNSNWACTRRSFNGCRLIAGSPEFVEPFCKMLLELFNAFTPGG